VIFVVAAYLGVCAVAIAAWHLVYRLQTEATHRNLLERVSLYETTIRQTIERFAYLPHILSRDPRIARLLERYTDAAAVAETNGLLEDFNAASGASALYVLDATGLTIAASNWSQPFSFVGRNYGFRPYFIDAMAKGRGSFYGVGVTTGEAGYFLSARVGAADKPLGVAAVKISLAGLESGWRAANEAVLLADRSGIVFLSSRPDWVYRALSPISPEAMRRIDLTHQYGGADLRQPPLFAPGREGDARQISGYAQTGAPKPYLIAEKALDDYQWRIAVLSDFAEINKQAWLAATIAALTAIILLLLAVVWAQRRATVRAKLRAHDLLEQRVTERTIDLIAANERLASEIEQRRLAEANLRQTQDELIHAGKLAALGHMSAAVSHEINQPLTALRTYVSSTSKLLRQGQWKLAAQNISRMDALLIRMADITGHLKRFARSEISGTGVCEIRSAVRNALDLLDAAIREGRVEVTVTQPDHPVFVRGAESRLEQVLINLLNNAIDAMENAPLRRIAIRIREDGEETGVEVEDTGCGIPADHQGLIFAPFFTTKDVGAGLGLGLSISHTIVTGFGGTLKAKSADGGGARFIMGLKSAGRGSAAPREAAE
jgi:two-component system C4-dicarboxylate transport sensor histidine kinase DctB